MSSRLCSVCAAIFSGRQRLRQEVPHHPSRQSLVDAAAGGCYLCSIIKRSPGFESLQVDAPFRSTWYLSQPKDFAVDWLRLTIDALGDDDSDRSGHSDADALRAETSEDEDDAGGTYSEVQLPSDGTDLSGFELPSAPLWAFMLAPPRAFQHEMENYDPPRILEDPAMMSLPRKWLRTCFEQHPKCRPYDPAFRPTRLVEITDEMTIRVVLSGNQPNILQQYATFSHCWGRSKSPKLLTSNIQQLRQGLAIEDLPTSYKEAINLCREFNIQYIWIDSLCIVQDSIKDWQSEALQMKDVYQNALLNISAGAAAENSQPSFSDRNPGLIRPLMVSSLWEGHSFDETGHYYLMDEAIYKDEIDESVLRRRAWVLQEAYLSGRNLSLTKTQLWWECRELTACEACPSGLPADWRYDVRRKLDSAAPDNLTPNHTLWCDLVEKYTACGLTVFSDKLIALSGVAAHFRSLVGGNDTYIAGMWRSQLPQALYWCTTKSRWTFRPATYRAPSWSWASIEGPVTLDHNLKWADDIRTLPACTILEVRVYSVNANETGLLKGGYIRLQGPMTKIGCWNEYLTMEHEHGDDSGPRFIPGSSEDNDDFSDEAADRTWFDVDENTPEGDPAFSSFDIDSGGGKRLILEDMTSSMRTARLWSSWIGTLWSLPVLEWTHGGRPYLAGLILAAVEGQGRPLYQRVGSFRADGPITTSFLKSSIIQEAMVI